MDNKRLVWPLTSVKFSSSWRTDQEITVVNFRPQFTYESLFTYVKSKIRVFLDYFIYDTNKSKMCTFLTPCSSNSLNGLTVPIITIKPNLEVDKLWFVVVMRVTGISLSNYWVLMSCLRPLLPNRTWLPSTPNLILFCDLLGFWWK